MKRWMFVIVGILVALLILCAAKDLIIKSAVESGTRMVTGLRLTMGSFRAGILNTLVHIKNLRILNPAGFKDRTMLDMPEIYVDYDLPAIFKGKVHLTEARIDMKEFIVVKNERGKLNLDSLKVVQVQKSGKSPKAQSDAKAPKIQIDKLRLKVGKVVYKDYSRPGAPRITEYDVRIDEEYRNITDPYALVSLIVVRSLANTSIARLANFDLGGLSGSIPDVLVNTQKAVTQFADTAKSATDTVKDVPGTASKAAGAVGDVLNDIFGSNK